MQTGSDGIYKKEDRRVRRTKRLLESSLTELLEEKPIQDITVRELTELADINRGTFYLYYKDIFDMVEKIETEYFNSFVEILGSHENETVIHQTRVFLDDLFTFIKENQRLCHVLLGEHGDMSFTQKIISVVREKCHNDWMRENSFRDSEDQETEFDYRYSFVTSGCLGIIRSWVARNCVEGVDVMSSLTESLIRQGSIHIL